MTNYSFIFSFAAYIAAGLLALAIAGSNWRKPYGSETSSVSLPFHFIHF